MDTPGLRIAGSAGFRGMAVSHLPWVLLAGLLLFGCSSPGDPHRIGAHARAVKGIAADSTNALLYLVAILKVQTRELATIERGFAVLKDHPKAQNLTGFQSLAPQLIGVSEAFRLTRPIRAEVKAAIARAQTAVDEIHKAVPGLTADLSGERRALGSSAKLFDQAHTELRSSIKNLEEFISAMTTYLDNASDMENSVNAMLRELDTLFQGATIQEQGAAVVRLSAFGDNLMIGLQKITAALQSEVSSQDAGLAALLKCFRSLDSIADLPADLSKEIREAIKLLDDVSKGVPFSPKPQ